jgi:hypothetical protein
MTSIPSWIGYLLETKKLTSAGLFTTGKIRTKLEKCLFLFKFNSTMWI